MLYIHLIMLNDLQNIHLIIEHFYGFGLGVGVSILYIDKVLGLLMVLHGDN